MRELQCLNDGIRTCLEEVTVPTFRFATFLAVDSFVTMFGGQLRKVGSIDPENLDQVWR